MSPIIWDNPEILLTARSPKKRDCCAKIETMVDSVAEVRDIVRVACEAISDADIRAVVEAHLIDPKLQMRTWEYGEDAIHPVWLIADTGTDGAGIAYSEYGHGPVDPWGLVFFDEDIFGMDSLWYKDLESLVLNLRVWNFTAPLGWEVP